MVVQRFMKSGGQKILKEIAKETSKNLRNPQIYHKMHHPPQFKKHLKKKL
jgi:hypothetical protein